MAPCLRHRTALLLPPTPAPATWCQIITRAARAALWGYRQGVPDAGVRIELIQPHFQVPMRIHVTQNERLAGELLLGYEVRAWEPKLVAYRTLVGGTVAQRG